MLTIKNKNIFKINDNEINNYLDARNKKFNKIKMINKKSINRLEHYNWWFSNKRNIFLYKINENQKIFFWDKKENIKKKKFLVGGWHSNISKINLYIILFINKWQINRLKKLNLPWIAVVNKNNKSIYKLCRYLGYIEIKSKNNLWFNIIEKFFNVSSKEFYYLIKFPK